MKRVTLLILAIFSTSLVFSQTVTTTGTNAGNQGDYGSFYGYGAGQVNTGAHNTFIGGQAGNSNTTGYNNTFIGLNSGFENITGAWNVFLGISSGYNNTVGNNNTFIGGQAGFKNTSGGWNAFLGTNSGYSNTSGINNTFIGGRAGHKNTSGRWNTFLGTSSGYSTTSGKNNTFIGGQAGYKNTTGKYNTFIGVNSGYNNQTGVSNVFIGHGVGYYETGSNKLYIDNSDTGSPLIYGDFATDQLAFNGTVRIGDVNEPTGYKLFVEQGILTEKVKVAVKNTGDWADYVFEKDYDLKQINEVEAFIEVNKHLPGIPSADEIVENGLNVAKMDAALLKQIEELWLHVIEMKKENEELKKSIKTNNYENK